MSARLLYIPAALVGGLHFCFFGTVLGTLLFLTIFGVTEGKPDLVLQSLRSFENAMMALYLGAICGGLAAFATGMVAGPLRLHMGSRLSFAVVMAPIGTVAMAIYLLILAPVLGGLPPAGMTILTGTAASFCCALPFGLRRLKRAVLAYEVSA